MTKQEFADGLFSALVFFVDSIKAAFYWIRDHSGGFAAIVDLHRIRLEKQRKLQALGSASYRCFRDCVDISIDDVQVASLCREIQKLEADEERVNEKNKKS